MPIFGNEINVDFDGVEPLQLMTMFLGDSGGDSEGMVSCDGSGDGDDGGGGGSCGDGEGCACGGGYPFGVGQSMVGKCSHEPRVDHPE